VRPPLASRRLVGLYGSGGVLGAAISGTLFWARLPWLAALAAWGAAALLVLAVLYLRATAGDDPARALRSGWTAVAYRLGLLPYRLLQYAWIVVRRLQAREPAMQAIGERIVLGGRALWWDCAAVRRLGIGASVDLAAELPEAPCVLRAVGERYFAAPALDGGAPPDATFDAAVDHAVEWANQGTRVLVHCALGHGRSALVAAAALVALGEVPDVDAAVARLRTHRPTVHLHGHQRAALDRWAARVSKA